MILRWTILIGLMLVALALIIPGCSSIWFLDDACKDAKLHYCEKLPTFDCYDGRMGDAKSRVTKECGSDDAHNFFQRAIGRCGVSGDKMSCPTD